jgi:16S rRNA (guanine527-N7)-methyltransferase
VPATDSGGHPPTLLRDILGEARDAGFLGPGPVEPHLLHAEGFVVLARRESAGGGDVSYADGSDSSPAPRILDLGSGGGLPGLVLATEWPACRVVLFDANQRRTDFLRRVVPRLELTDRVSVVHDRAESGGRDPELRGAFDGVVVRSFGPPAVVAECAAPFLRVGGWLIVSEPPAGEPGGPDGESGAGAAVNGMDDGGASASRWPAQPLRQFGLEPGEFVRDTYGYQILRQVELCPERFPRRNGVPAKSPLF